MKLSLNTYLNNISLNRSNAGKTDRWLDNANDSIDSIFIYMEDLGEVISSKTGVDRIDRFYDTGWLEMYKENKKIGLKAFLLETRVPLNREIAENENEYL